MDATASAAEFERLGTRFDQIASALELNGEFLRDLPVLLPAEDLRKILVLSNGTVGVVIASRISSESSVVGIDERGGECVGRLDRGNAR